MRLGASILRRELDKVNNEIKSLIKMENLKKYFPLRKEGLFQKETLYVKANDDITLEIHEGETFGLVGESGCGKSTLGRVLLQLYDQTDGRTMYYGRDIDDLAPSYVLDILSNLERDKKLLEKLKSQGKDDEYRKLFNDLVQLIGGFILVDDIKPISNIMVKEYKQAVDIRKDHNEISRLEFILGGKNLSKSKINKTQEKIEKLKKEIDKKQIRLDKTRANIYKLVEKYQELEDFDKYEMSRDKGVNLARLTENEMRPLRKDLQLIFQDPYSSLNPKMTVGQIISEGLLAHKIFNKQDKKLQEYVLETMEKCGLAPYFIHRYPHQFSGGQRQRIGIARALALNPKFVVCDEAVSALDVSIQSQIINLLLDLKEKENLTYLFISHDLSVIKYISDRVGVMYLGNIVELASTEDLFAYPIHPYTEALLSAIPTTDLHDDKEVILLEGHIPSPVNPPSGCKFHTRCQYATDICKEVEPEFEEARPNHFVACHHKLNMKV